MYSTGVRMAARRGDGQNADKAAPRRQAYEFIRENRAAALATADNHGTPHAATIYCFVDEDLNLYFSTRVEGRKYRNMRVRPEVALAFSNERKLQTIQLTGIAERVNNLEVEQNILHDLITLRYGEPNWPVPPVKLFERGATNELAIMKIVPREMVFGNFETSKNGRYKAFFAKII